MAAALQLSESQAVCQSKRRQQLSEIIGRWRCSNPDQQWVRTAASKLSLQNLGCIGVTNKVSMDCSNRDMFAWLRDESCLQVDWSTLLQVPQRDATVVLRFTFRSTRLNWLLGWQYHARTEIYRRLCPEIKLREKGSVIYYSTYEGALSHSTGRVYLSH